MHKRYNFSLEDSMMKALRDYASKTGLKMSTIVEKAVMEFIKNKKQDA